MTRPRIAAIASTIIASTAAFLVVSRWGLLGTVTGAAIIPVVYSLVSHFSAESIERFGGWLRRKSRRGGSDVTPTLPEKASKEDDGLEKSEPAKVRRPVSVWPAAIVAVVALAISAYSLSIAGEPGETRVEQQVIEKTVVVTVEGERQLTEAAPNDQVGSSGPASTTTTVVDQSTSTTEPDGEEPSTTTDTPPTSEEEPTPTTTTERQSSTTTVTQ